MKVGIEKVGIYPCSMALQMPKLCAARNHDPANIRDEMLVDERGVNPPWEDPVTMAVHAARTILSKQDCQDIELLIVSSESSVDQEKPLSTWVHRYLGLTENCRNFEVKHACYSGTVSLKMALGWIASGMAGDKKALVVNTDQSRGHFHRAWEYVMGAGAAAVLISKKPGVLEIPIEQAGYWTDEVSDLTRPTSHVETGNTELSLLSYLNGLDGAYSHYLERLGHDIDYDTFFKRNIYHTPFGGMTFLAHKAMLRRAMGKISKEAAWEHFARKTLPSIRYNRRMGSTYGGSTFVALAGLLAHDEAMNPGDRLSMFSYGSGSCAEFYTGFVGADARATALAAHTTQLLDERYQLSVTEYENCERDRMAYIDDGDYRVSTGGYGDWYDRHYKGKGKLVFRGIQEHYRQYDWS